MLVIMKKINKSQLSIALLKKMKPVFIVILFLIVVGSSLTTIVHAASFPSLKVEPESVDFGAFTVGLSSPAQTITITNDVDSTNVLVIFDIYLDGPDADSFTIINDNCSGNILDGSISSTLEVIFKPDSAGNKDAILMIPSNATAWPYEIALSGIGIASNNNQTSTPTDSETGNTLNNNQTSEPADDSLSTNWPLIIGIFVGVVVVIAGILIARRLTSK